VRVLVVGSGGREHALVWKLAQSRRVSNILVAPGNAGTSALGENVAISAADIAGLVNLALHRGVDFVVVGPEAPLTLGLVDELQLAGIPAFGPTRGAAQLEGSKAFAHAIMEKCGVPCAQSRSFTSFQSARAYADTLVPPFVVKADGLAAGKGAIIVSTMMEAHQALEDMLVKRIFGAAGDKVVIEEFLTGREVSLLAFSDSQRVAAMVPSCDYKRALDGDRGPNTGGMGCYSPPGFFSPEQVAHATRTIIEPVIRQMAYEGKPYKGVLYAGLMVDGDAMHVLEFNARFGDPETQVILPRLESDLLEIMLACHAGNLAPGSISWSDDCSVAVVLASGGYPGAYEKGRVVSGLESCDYGSVVFHAGTRTDPSGHTVTDGGRVLNVVGIGANMTEARERAYQRVSAVRFDGMMYRSDIALREVS